MNFPFYYKYEDERIQCNLKLNEMITLVGGDSGTGKTYISKIIKSNVTEPTLRRLSTSNIDFDKTYVCLDKTDLDGVYNRTGHLIILDRFDTYADKKLVDYIRTTPNLYIIMFRGGNYNLQVRLDALVVLKSEERNGKTYFYTEDAL